MNEIDYNYDGPPLVPIQRYNGLRLATDIDDVWIVAHGFSGFDYTKECIESFSQYDNLIWSSWDDTTPDVVDLLAERKVYTTLNKYPKEKGKSTLNWQRWGFLNGLESARLLGAKYVYKIRNDFDIVNLDLLMKRLKYKVEKSGKLQLLCWDNLCGGVCDYGMFGPIDEMEFYWQFEDIECASERELIAQYFKRKGQPYDYRFKTASQLIETYIRELEKLEVSFNRYKWIEESPLQEHFKNRCIYI